MSKMKGTKETRGKRRRKGKENKDRGRRLPARAEFFLTFSVQVYRLYNYTIDLPAVYLRDIAHENMEECEAKRKAAAKAKQEVCGENRLVTSCFCGWFCFSQL